MLKEALINAWTFTYKRIFDRRGVK